MFCKGCPSDENLLPVSRVSFISKVNPCIWASNFRVLLFVFEVISDLLLFVSHPPPPFFCFLFLTGSHVHILSAGISSIYHMLCLMQFWGLNLWLCACYTELHPTLNHTQIFSISEQGEISFSPGRSDSGTLQGGSPRHTHPQVYLQVLSRENFTTTISSLIKIWF